MSYSYDSQSFHWRICSRKYVTYFSRDDDNLTRIKTTIKCIVIERKWKESTVKFSFYFYISSELKFNMGKSNLVCVSSILKKISPH